MSNKIVNLGFNNAVLLDRIIAVVSYETAPIKRLKEEALRRNKLVDATNGRKTRTVVITDSDHIILTAALPETLIARLEETKKS